MTNERAPAFETDDPLADGLAPRAALRRAEALLRQRRAHPADMAAAVEAALRAALDGPPPPEVARAAGLIAAAVAAHAAGFPAGTEPAYHDQRHQAEATLAMGWLCGAARRLGLLDATQAAIGVLAMAGHDLRHDGAWHSGGTLEAYSAGLTASFAAQAGMDAEACAELRRIIEATDPLRPAALRDADDLVCRLAQEADLFGSITPELGWDLGRALAREMAASGQTLDPPVGSLRGRLTLFRDLVPPTTVPGASLGLRQTVDDQVAAMADLGGGDPDRGAARLDAMPAEEARAAYLAALAAREAA